MLFKLEGYGAADLHIHTTLGDGMASIPQILEYVERETALDVIAITDHDDIEGSYQARELAARGNYRFSVLVGLEVTTLEGHLLALFLERPVPSLQPLAKTIEAIHAQDGLCIIPHPLSWLTRSIGQGAIERVLRSSELYFDGIEVANPTLAGRVSAEKVRRLNQRRFGLPETGGSDAHFLAQIGSAYTLFEGRTHLDFRRSLRERTTLAMTQDPASLGRIGYGKIVAQQFKGLVVLPYRILRREFLRLVRGEIA